MSSSADMYVAVTGGSQAKLVSSSQATDKIAAEVERLWSNSRANDKAGETVSFIVLCHLVGEAD